MHPIHLQGMSIPRSLPRMACPNLLMRDADHYCLHCSHAISSQGRLEGAMCWLLGISSEALTMKYHHHSLTGPYGIIQPR